ncbi:hypothetical protein ACQKIY_25055 [Bacillus mycoides]|uniref:hypothetical protein n=1 Tax=Bacillus mycoides TaxID=1405 RepID=UPI003D060DF8
MEEVNIDIGATKVVKDIFECFVEAEDRDEILRNLYIDYHNPKNPSNFSFNIVRGVLFIGFKGNHGDFIVSTMDEIVDRVSNLAVDCGERHG